MELRSTDRLRALSLDAPRRPLFLSSDLLLRVWFCCCCCRILRCDGAWWADWSFRLTWPFEFWRLIWPFEVESDTAMNIKMWDMIKYNVNYHLTCLIVSIACEAGLKILLVYRCYFGQILPLLKGCGMGTLFVLVSPCFRENVAVKCKMGSFLCSLDNLLQKNVIVFSFGNQISKWRSFEKKGYFDLLFTFFSHQGKFTKTPSAHISLTYIHVFCSPFWLFLPYQFWKKKYEFIRYGFSLVWVLVLILICAILEQSINNKMVSKI